MVGALRRFEFEHRHSPFCFVIIHGEGRTNR